MQITQEQIAAAHAQLLPPGSIHTMADTLAAVEKVGFAWPFTVGTRRFPALFPALAAESEGQRWDMMWGWKDKLAAERLVYYGKVAGDRPTFVSREWLPRFYALTGNTGELEDDLAHAAETTGLSDMARKACLYLHEYGPTGTRKLQAQLTDGSKEAKRALEKALDELDSSMLIAKCGVEGGSSFANLWDLFPRVWPEAVEAGTEIPTRTAAELLVFHYFMLTPAVGRRALETLFPWSTAHQQRAIEKLAAEGHLLPCQIDGKPGLRRADFTP